MRYDDRPVQTDLSPATGEIAQVPESQPMVLEVLIAQRAPETKVLPGMRCSVGSHPSNDVVVDDATVSRFHCEIVLDEARPRLRDLGSLNGTLVDGVPVTDAWLRNGSAIAIGTSTLRFRFGEDFNKLPVSGKEDFGTLVGKSLAMRHAFYLMERATTTDSTLLLEGETGTGKDSAAQAIHERSLRRHGPFVVVDCAAIAPSLIESELFGHTKGAFTGAVSARRGAFAAASGGTVFLDELGELPLELQPKLLRVLEQRAVQPVGSNERQPVDVRVIAATHRDLRAAINQGLFREDLYYRIAVLRIRVPPLRERPEDLPLLVERIRGSLKAAPDMIHRLGGEAFLRHLGTLAWPGNVRELRNYLEQAIFFAAASEVPQAEPVESQGSADTAAGYDHVPNYQAARREAIDRFEASYLRWLLSRYGDNISEAARRADVDRRWLYRLRDRHSL